jgi:precorrin-6B methylase 2
MDRARGARLHAVVGVLAAQPWDVLVDVDAGDGVHAAMLAHRARHAIVHAFESDDAARRALCAAAETWGVASRLGIAAACRPEELDALLHGESLVVCHGEAVAAGVLDLVAVPALRSATLAVALRDGPEAAGRLHGALARTHMLDLADPRPGGWAVWLPSPA